MVDIENLVGANIEGMEDKAIGYMVVFTVSETFKVPVEKTMKLLQKYGYDNLIEQPTPKKAFKRSMKKIRQMREKRQIELNRKTADIEVAYDTIQSGGTVYLIRKFKIISGKKSGVVDTERLARLYISNKNQIMVEPITRHLYSKRTVLSDKEIEALKNFIVNEYNTAIENFEDTVIRNFIREKILRYYCLGIPFINRRGGVWFVMNTEDRVNHLLNIKEIVKKLSEYSISGKINMIIIPLFDSEDIRNKLKEDLETELKIKYRQLLKNIMNKLMYAKSGEDIEKLLSDMLDNEKTLKSLLKEYSHIIKSSISIELEGLEELKTDMIKIMEEKKADNIQIDTDKMSMIVMALGNYKEDNIEVKSANENKETETKIFDTEKLKILYEEISRSGVR